MKSYGPLLIFIAAVLWATDAPFRTLLTHDLSSNFIVLGEHVVATLFVLPLLLRSWADIKKLSRNEWLAVAFISLCGSALATVAFTQAFHYVNPSIAILLQKLQPLIAIVLSAIVLKEKLHTRFYFLALTALCGAYLISFPDLIPRLYVGEVFNPNILGVSLALVAALFWGTATVMGKFALRTLDFKLVTALRFSIALVFLGVLNVATNSFPAEGIFTTYDACLIGIIALVSGVFSLLLYYRGLKTTKASVATLAELGFPVGSVIVNWLFIPGSALTVVQMMGIGILLASVWGLRTEEDATLPA